MDFSNVKYAGISRVLRNPSTYCENGKQAWKKNKYNGLRQIIFEGEAKKYCTAFVKTCLHVFYLGVRPENCLLICENNSKKIIEDLNDDFNINNVDFTL